MLIDIGCIIRETTTEWESTMQLTKTRIHVLRFNCMHACCSKQGYWTLINGSYTMEHDTNEVQKQVWFSTPDDCLPNILLADNLLT